MEHYPFFYSSTKFINPTQKDFSFDFKALFKPNKNYSLRK